MIITDNGGAGSNDEDTGKFLSVDSESVGRSMRKIDSWADFLNKLDEHEEKAKNGGNGPAGFPAVDMNLSQATQQQHAAGLFTRSSIGEAHDNNSNEPGQNTGSTVVQGKDQVSWAQSHLLVNHFMRRASTSSNDNRALTSNRRQSDRAMSSSSSSSSSTAAAATVAATTTGLPERKMLLMEPPSLPHQHRNSNEHRGNAAVTGFHQQQLLRQQREEATHPGAAKDMRARPLKRLRTHKHQHVANTAGGVSSNGGSSSSSSSSSRRCCHWSQSCWQ